MDRKYLIVTYDSGEVTEIERMSVVNEWIKKNRKTQDGGSDLEFYIEEHLGIGLAHVTYGTVDKIHFEGQPIEIEELDKK